jgi:membrane protein
MGKQRRNETSTTNCRSSLRQARRIVVDCIRSVDDHHILAFSAALSFYLILAIFPALIALSAIVGSLPIPNLFDTVVDTMASVMPPESKHLLQRVTRDIISPHGTSLISVGILGAIWSASGSLSSTMEALNICYCVTETRPFWLTRSLAILFTLVSGGLTVLAFSLIIIGRHIGTWLASRIQVINIVDPVLPAIRYLLASVCIMLAVMLVYRYAPNFKSNFKQAFPGAALAVVVWLILSTGLNLYFQKVAQLNHTYGVLGGAIALLLWLYLTAFAMLLGAELNAELIRAVSSRALPDGESVDLP